MIMESVLTCDLLYGRYRDGGGKGGRDHDQSAMSNGTWSPRVKIVDLLLLFFVKTADYYITSSKLITV